MQHIKNSQSNKINKINKMRTITEQASQAFNLGKNWRKDNTAVNRRIGGVELVLHGHIIAKRIYGEGLSINLCGWNTPTTRERLKAVGVYVSTRKGQAFLEGKPIDSDGWVKVETA